MLLALSSTGIRAEAVVSHFKAKGGWKSTEVHFDMTFMADSSISVQLGTRGDIIDRSSSARWSGVGIRPRARASINEASVRI